MRSNKLLFQSFFKTILTFALAVTVGLATTPASWAGPTAPDPNQSKRLSKTSPAGPIPSLGEINKTLRRLPVLSRADRVVALESVQFGLSRVSDGSSYIWHRSHGRLSGIVHPTKSFKDRDGKVCRHFEVIYVAGDHTKALQTVGCRLDNGVWEIGG